MSEPNPAIEFRLLTNFSGYRVSNAGRVQSCRKRGSAGGFTSEWRDLKVFCLHGRDYLHVNLCKGAGIVVKRQVHCLVLEAFVGPCPPEMECRHLDGNPANNHLWNLAWGTKKENSKDRICHATTNRGEKNWSAIRRKEQVKAIRALAAKGENRDQLAIRFGVTKRNIEAVIYRESWKHI